MIICYSTEDYYDWLPIFLKSFYHFNKNGTKIHINTRNLTEKQIGHIYDCYDNVVVENKTMTLNQLSKEHNIPVKTILESRNGCNSKKKHDHRLWMNIIADGDRINSYYDTVLKYPDEELYLLLDVDFLFRGNIDHVFEKILKYDVGIRIRKKSFPKKINIKNKRIDSIINIATVALNNNKNALHFLDRWIHHINKKPMIKRNHFKWGQYAIALAYNDCSNFNFYRYMDEFDSSLGKKSTVWFFKTKRKQRDIKIAKNELQRILNG